MGADAISRKLAALFVEELKRLGHILVVKGGTEGLTRELDELVQPVVVELTPLMETPRAVTGEVTSTFGDEHADELAEDLVELITGALMDSEHVEDIFAEDHVINRDTFRTFRTAVESGLFTLAEPDPVDAPPISVRLHSLGYVASKVTEQAEKDVLVGALERAALATDAELARFDAEGNQAFFAIPEDDPEQRLEIEEAVADELTDLARTGQVKLPTLVRSVPLLRTYDKGERAGLRPLIETVWSQTVLGTGAIARLRFEDEQTLTLTFTPLSDQDGPRVDKLTAAFSEALLLALTDLDDESDVDDDEVEQLDIDAIAAIIADEQAAAEKAGTPSSRPADVLASLRQLSQAAPPPRKDESDRVPSPPTARSAELPHPEPKKAAAKRAAKTAKQVSTKVAKKAASSAPPKRGAAKKAATKEAAVPKTKRAAAQPSGTKRAKKKS